MYGYVVVSEREVLVIGGWCKDVWAWELGGEAPHIHGWPRCKLQHHSLHAYLQVSACKHQRNILRPPLNQRDTQRSWTPTACRRPLPSQNTEFRGNHHPPANHLIHHSHCRPAESAPRKNQWFPPPTIHHRSAKSTERARLWKTRLGPVNWRRPHTNRSPNCCHYRIETTRCGMYSSLQIVAVPSISIFIASWLCLGLQ